MFTDSNELIGQALGTCTLQRLLGRGGMGAVYLARQSRPRRTVAIKVLMPGVFMEHPTSGEFLARFRREADAIAALDHINIMPIYEYGEQEDLAYLVMPYVTGGTLRQVLEKRRILPIPRILSIVDQAAAALDCAHAQGIVHRDLKPGNMLFHADGRMLLADFGLAKTINEARESESNGHTALTTSGTIIGTPEYLSPEQGAGRPVDSRTDIYSLGIVIFQMLVGRVPFLGPSPVAVAIKHALEEPPSLTQLNPDVPPALEAIVLKAIAKNPDDRFASAIKLAQALRQAAMEIHATPRTPEALEASQVTLGDPQHPATSELHNAPTEENPRLERQAISTKDDSPGVSSQPTGDKEEPPTGSEHTEQATNDEDLDQANTLITTEKEQPPARLTANRPAGTKRKKAVVASTRHVEARQEKPRPALPAIEERPREVQKEQKPNVQVLTDEQALPAYQFRSGKLRERRIHPVPMMLLGSLITLLIVGGGLGTYLYFNMSKPQQHQSTPNAVHATSTTAPNTPGRTPQTLPPAQIATGPLLYGTNLPGPQCDTTPGAKWSRTANATVNCENNATGLSNSNGGGPAAIYLDTMPGKTYPGTYIIQVQVDLSSSSGGEFGIFFLHQAGKGVVYMVNPGGSLEASTYDESTGALDRLFSRGLTQGQLHGLVTVDVVVQHGTYLLYINEIKEGTATSSTPQQGGAGLAVASGATVKFKNFAVYAS